MKNKKIILFCFIVSLIILLIASKSSPLYPLNDWCDANAFFTMGKGLFNGKIIFKDLFEQKGPFLYLIYGIGYLISNTSFTGVFILEVISSTIFLYITHKIINLYLKEKYSYIILPLFALILYTSVAFRHGSSCEEFCFPMIIYSLYELIKYAKTNKINNKKIYIVGIMAGLIFLTKYTLLGVNFAFILCIFISLIKQKKYKKAINYTFIYVLGIITPIIPWLIYFALNNAIKDFFNVYIFINLFSYTKANVNIFTKLLNCFICFAKNLYSNKLYILIIFTSLLIPIFNKKINIREKIVILSALICSIIFIYIGGIYFAYYILPILIFILFILIYIVKKVKIKLNKYLYIPYIILIIILTYVISPNTYLMKYKKEDLVQYKFKDIIMQKENPTILNYGFLDMGFYTTTGIVPNTKYFEKLNFDYKKYPENIDELNKYIDNKEIDFVIFVAKGKESFPITESLIKNYKLISQEKQKYEGKTYYYYLYELKEI